MQIVRGSSRLLGTRQLGEQLIARSAVATRAAVATLLLGACGSGEGTPPGQEATATPTRQVSAFPTPTEPEPSLELPREWVAVFRVAEAQQLNEETQELLRLVPHNIAIAPVICWVGLRERLDNATGYVSAVVADSRNQLDRVVRKVGRQPILVGEFPSMCIE
jgi:hypothetical protein